MKALRRRRASENLFRCLSVGAVSLSIGMLALILFSVMSLSIRAFTHNAIEVELTLDGLSPAGSRVVDETPSNIATLNRLIHERIALALGRSPSDATAAAASPKPKLFAPIAASDMAAYVANRPELMGATRSYWIPLSSRLDLYLKGNSIEESIERFGSIDEGEALVRASDVVSRIYTLPVYAELSQKLITERPGEKQIPKTLFIETDNAIFKVVDQRNDSLDLQLLAGVFADPAVPLRLRIVSRLESQRAISDQEIAEVNYLKNRGFIQTKFNSRIWTHADSTYPELAGVLSAIAGSMLTLVITALASVPIGIMAAIWLEELAPRNRATDFIEVNINNLAAVPPIVFGLLGAAVLLNFLGLPRSTPIAGGLVLACLTLPTVIIASRAALRAVSSDMRVAALSLGASRMQVVTDHVLPAAAPGIMTGVILGLARSLGETAPLLLIGMVIFIGEVPSGIADEATTLPVLIYKWSTGAERAWEPMTAAAIVILLLIMVLINLLLSYLRQRFER